MPRSPTSRASKKEKGKAPAARRRASPWSRSGPLLNGLTLKQPNGLHSQHPSLIPPTRRLYSLQLTEVAIVLFTLYSKRRDAKHKGVSISIQEIMDEMDKHLKLDGSYSLRSRQVRLTHVRDALSSFEAKDFLEWHGLQHDNELDERVELDLALRAILDELFGMVQAQMQGVELSSLTKVQHRVLGMWFRGLVKELGIINLTKNDWRKSKDALKKLVRSANPASSGQPTANRADEAGVGGDHDIDISGDEALTSQNAAAGPSHQPQTPGRSRRTLNSAEAAYPTPNSRPRQNLSNVHDDAAQAGPRIPALSLPTPAGTDSDGDDFQDASEEMAVDEAPLTSRELNFLQQISEQSKTIDRLEKKTERLEKENIILGNDMEALDTQLEKEREYVWQKLQERKTLRAVEDAKWKFMGLWRRERSARIEQLDNEIAEARSVIERYETEVDSLRDFISQKDAEMVTLQQTVADHTEKLRVQQELLHSTESFCTVFMSNRQRG